MTYTIQNDFISLTVDSQGAEMVRLQHASGTEYLWDANPDTWARHAPVLFPIVGKLNNNTYKLGDDTFHLPQHGFARDQAFRLVKQTNTELEFVLSETDNTLKVYPFPFSLAIGYIISRNVVTVSYSVKNTGTGVLPFSIGAHPAFMLSPKVPVSEYFIEFEKSESPFVHPLVGGLINPDKIREIPLVGNTIQVSSELFKDDALIFSGLQSSWVALVHKESGYRVQVSIEGFPWLGLWGKDHVPFVCIEPWQGHADFTNHNHKFMEKSGIIKLEAGKVHACSFTIAVD